MSEFSRRDALRFGLAGGAVVAASGCARIANHFAEHHRDIALPPGDFDETSRLVNRATFGPRPGDVAAAKAMGKEAYVDSLLADDDDEDIRLKFLLGRLEVFELGSFDSLDLPEDEVVRQLQTSAILRATYGKHQLRERMVDFWTNHFNIYSRKGLTAFRKGSDEMSVVRQHALGKFTDLLQASAHSPAMLMYLDNQSNVKGRPNENYAREIMELHTMGVKSGYTQRDVQELARCFTGWTIEQRFLHRKWTFLFDPSRHDDGEKRVLGHTIPAGGGEKDVKIVLDMLARHPATAHFISKKICAYFLGSDGDKWVDRTAETYQKTGGDIRSMLRPLLLSPELASSPPIVKRPFDYMVSAMRAMDSDTDGGAAIQQHLEKMGEPLYQWPMPDGYPTRTASWTGSMLPRWNFAYALAANKIRGTSIQLADRLTPELLFEQTHARRPGHSDEALVSHLGKEIDKDPAGACFLCLAAPAFQWR